MVVASVAAATIYRELLILIYVHASCFVVLHTFYSFVHFHDSSFIHSLMTYTHKCKFEKSCHQDCYHLLHVLQCELYKMTCPNYTALSGALIPSFIIDRLHSSGTWTSKIAASPIRDKPRFIPAHGFLSILFSFCVFFLFPYAISLFIFSIHAGYVSKPALWRLVACPSIRLFR